MTAGNPNIKNFGFKPGQSGNPGGHAKVPEDVREARQISQFEFERIVNKYLFLNDEDTKEDLARPEATNFERLVGGIIQKAISKRDEKKAEWILSRTLGKMRERLEISSQSLKINVQANTSHLPSVEQLALENPDLTPAQLESFADKLTKLREEVANTKKFQHTVALSAAEEKDIIDV